MSGAWSILEAALSSGAEVDQLYLDVISPALVSIGERWEHGEIDVADEHRASAVTGRLIGRLGPRFTRPGRTRGSVVLGAAPGDAHGLPVAMLADLVVGKGFEVVDLGPDVPTASFVHAAGKAARLVAVGVAGHHLGTRCLGAPRGRRTPSACARCAGGGRGRGHRRRGARGAAGGRCARGGWPWIRAVLKRLSPQEHEEDGVGTRVPRPLALIEQVFDTGRMIVDAPGDRIALRPSATAPGHGTWPKSGCCRSCRLVAGLLPGAGLQRGASVVTTGQASTALALALVAGASTGGSWIAVVGIPSLGLLAGAELGVCLERMVLIDSPEPSAWGTVVAALLDAFEVVVVCPKHRVRPADQRRLLARSRERGAVLVQAGGRPDAWPRLPTCG